MTEREPSRQPAAIATAIAPDGATAAARAKQAIGKPSRAAFARFPLRYFHRLLKSSDRVMIS
jgi:hypothetical protein